jgi:hypothetical protein
MIARLMLCAALLLSVSPIMAQTLHSSTGRDMLRHCAIVDRITSRQLSRSEAASAPEDAMIQGFCLGAIAGVSFLAAASTKNTQYPICVPENAPRGQVVSVVVRYLQTHPERLNDDFLWLVMNAQREAWPCR